jgi:hypothetical protein
MRKSALDSHDLPRRVKARLMTVNYIADVGPVEASPTPAENLGQLL